MPQGASATVAVSRERLRSVPMLSKSVLLFLPQKNPERYLCIGTRCSPKRRVTPCSHVPSPDELGRGLSTPIAKDLIGKEQNILPFPLQTTFMSPLRKAALDQQKHEMVLFWGGQIAPILKHRKAADLMKALIEETKSALKV